MFCDGTTDLLRLTSSRDHPLDDPAENVPNHDHLLLVHHVNLSGLVVFDCAIRPLIAREPALTNLLELTTLRTLGYLRPLAGSARPFS